MTTEQARELLNRRTPQTSEELMEAIKALGSTEEQIKQNLLDMGFQNYSQTDTFECPVCQYLKSIGIQSPYVVTCKVGFYNLKGGKEDFDNRIEISLTIPDQYAMYDFQSKAAYGEHPEFAGYEPEDDDYDESEEGDY